MTPNWPVGRASSETRRRTKPKVIAKALSAKTAVHAEPLCGRSWRCRRSCSPHHLSSLECLVQVETNET